MADWARRGADIPAATATAGGFFDRRPGGLQGALLMVFEVLSPGPATTIQDRGRPGFGAYGVPEGGAMDRGLMAAANRLVDNPGGAPTLEFALKGPRLWWRGSAPLRCAIAADAVREVALAPGDELDAGGLTQRVYGYVAVRGGLEVRSVMGARGTCLPGGFGGLDGRELRKGDRLAVGNDGLRSGAGAKPSPTAGEVHEPKLENGTEPVVVRILPGGRSGRRGRAFGRLIQGEWRAGQGNRVGLRLEGPRIAERALHFSEPIPPGAIQVTGAGWPILLLRDHPTIGGYPVIAVVVTADLDVCAQLRPAARVRFVGG